MMYHEDRTTQDGGTRGIQVRQPVITPPHWTPPEPDFEPPPERAPEILPDNVQPWGPEHDPNDDPFQPSPSPVGPHGPEQDPDDDPRK
jgi:hypothetical protein